MRSDGAVNGHLEYTDPREARRPTRTRSGLHAADDPTRPRGNVRPDSPTAEARDSPAPRIPRPRIDDARGVYGSVAGAVGAVEELS